MREQGNNEITDLKKKTIRGGFIALCSQPAIFIIRAGSVMILARILLPEEFGLVGMVTAVTGVIGLFKDGGLSLVTIQRSNITDEQVTILFWINIVLGVILVGLSIAIAPVLVSFYREPRLYWITVALGSGFIFNAAATQHQALLNRQMQYVTLVGINVFSLFASVVVGIVMAVGGFGYWALVGMQVALPVVNAICVWLAMPWTPSIPRRNAETRSMLNFGGTVTLNSLVLYFAYNMDKILLGRYWGAESLGMYGRAYQLYNLPLVSLNSTVVSISFPTLSRLQDDPERFRNYFLRGYSLIIGLTIPFVIGCALFADDLIFLLLGPNWNDAAAIFRLLAPAGLALALFNPFGSLVMSKGYAARGLKMALVIAPVVILGYVIGLPFGSKGIAAGFSSGMILLILPLVLWARHGTSVTSQDIIKVISRPFLSGVVAGVFTVGVQFYFSSIHSPYLRIIMGGFALIIMYSFILLYVLGQRKVYYDLLIELRRSLTKEDK